MQIDRACSYLSVSCHQSEKRVLLSNALPEAISRWTRSSRVSPVWPIKEFQADDAPLNAFPGEHSLLFLGPIQPSLLLTSIASIARTKGLPAGRRPDIWVSLGMYNVILRFPANDEMRVARNEVCEWAKTQGIPYENWKIADGVIEDARDAWSNPPSIEKELLALSQELSDLAGHTLRPSLDEYFTLTASALSRGDGVANFIRNHIISIHSQVRSLISAHKNGEIKRDVLESSITTINAALSRFSSQSFAGISPISETECHYWIHSLLGIGVANIALHNVVDFVRLILGEQRIPQKIAAMAYMAKDTPDFDALTSDLTLPRKDILGSVDDTMVRNKIAESIISYFSGRDGFSSHIMTISAPLSAVAECNCYSSSLMTITHEISHIFVQGVLGEIYPSWESDDDIEDAYTRTRPKYEPQNWLDAVRQLLLVGVLNMQMDAQGYEMEADQITRDFLRDSLKTWRREVQEIMVHTFDFLYFYGGEAEPYIDGIWQSWSAIPGIGDRIPEYLLRTLCAISAHLIEDNPRTWAPSAYGRMLEVLRHHDGMPYIRTAMGYLEQNWDKRLRASYERRLMIVRLVTTFLHSRTVAARLLGDEYRTSGPKEYPHRYHHFSGDLIGNPLRFLSAHMRKAPDPSSAVWMLHMLAFNLADSAGEA